MQEYPLVGLHKVWWLNFHDIQSWALIGDQDSLHNTHALWLSILKACFSIRSI
jgi:hypothetical protein